MKKDVTKIINIFEPESQNSMQKEHCEEINLEVLPGIHKVINNIICLLLEWMPNSDITTNICGNTINNSSLSSPICVGKKYE